LILAHGQNIDVKTPTGWTPLHCACIAGHVQRVDFLLTSGAAAQASAKDRNECELTPMAMAASRISPEKEEDNTQYAAVIRALERAGVTIDLFAAISLNDRERVATILRDSPRAGETRNPQGEPALYRAVTLNRREIVSMLLDQ